MTSVPGPPEPSESRFNELALRLLTDREHGVPSDPDALRVEFPEFAAVISSLVQADTSLDDLLPRLSMIRPPPPTLIGTHIGDIELIAFLGSGGQGEVYVGRQTWTSDGRSAPARLPSCWRRWRGRSTSPTSGASCTAT
ncbi:MAG: hypothetical protein ABGY75_15420 [Gemmataceae bacterium]